MKHGRCLITIVLATALLGGCQADDGTSGRLLVDPLVAQQQLDYNVDWQIDLAVPEGNELVYAELLDDRLVTLEDGNIVSVVDANDGRIMWRAQITRPIDDLSRPQRDGDRLVVSSQRRAYVHDIHTGELHRIIPLRHVSLGTPVVIDNLMIHASPRGVIFAQELDTGLQAWNFQIDVGFASPPTLKQGRLFAGDLAGNVWCFEPIRGTRQWTRTVAEPVIARPDASDRIVYVPSTDQSLYALLLRNGRPQWRHYATASLNRSPFYVEDFLLQEVSNDALISLDPEEGDVLWRNEELLNARPLQLRGETLDLYHRGSIVHLDIRDGSVTDTTDLPGVEHVVAESRTGGPLYLMRLNGRILKASPR